MNRTIIIVAVLFLALLAIYFLYYGGNNNSTPEPILTGTDVVTIKDFVFMPPTLTVSPGSAVTWINQDSAEHEIKSATFNSPPLAQGESFSFTFERTGTYDYTCAIHPAMSGKIIVK